MSDCGKPRPPADVSIGDLVTSAAPIEGRPRGSDTKEALYRAKTKSHVITWS